MNKYYGGVIWTNHILDRMKERGLSQKHVLWVFNHPDKAIAATDPGAHRFFRDYEQNRIEVVAKKADDGRWILMSCWVKPLNQINKKREGWFPRLIRWFAYIILGK